jgi:hypothetical protein
MSLFIRWRGWKILEGEGKKKSNIKVDIYLKNILWMGVSINIP